MPTPLFAHPSPPRGHRIAAVAVVALAIAAPALAHHTAAHRTAERLDEAARRHELKGLDGRRFSLETLRGEVVVVNFWASWCAPCRGELPRLDALNTEVSKQGARVVAISIDRELANVRRFATRHRLTLPICHDGPDGLAKRLDLEHVPFTIVLDRNGAVAFTSEGADRKSLEKLESVVRRLATERPPVAQTEPEGR